MTLPLYESQIYVLDTLGSWTQVQMCDVELSNNHRRRLEDSDKSCNLLNYKLSRILSRTVSHETHVD